MSRCFLSTNAYCKAVLHASKFFYRPVTGILLGEEKDGAVKVVDAIPAFHNIPLAPMLEVVMTQLEEHAQSRSLQIVGCYFAPELAKTQELSDTAVLIADKISRYFPQACILKVGNVGVGEDAPNVCQAYQRRGEAWEEIQCMIDHTVAAVKKLAMHNHDERLLVDFEDHLEDIRKDWVHQDLPSLVPIQEEFK